MTRKGRKPGDWFRFGPLPLYTTEAGTAVNRHRSPMTGAPPGAATPAPPGPGTPSRGFPESRGWHSLAAARLCGWPMSHPELLDIEGDFHGAGRLRASVAYDDRNVGRFRLVRVAVPHDFDGGPDGFKSSGCGVYQVKPVLVLDGYAVGANVEVEVRHGRQCHASQAVALTYERGRPPTAFMG